MCETIILVFYIGIGNMSNQTGQAYFDESKAAVERRRNPNGAPWFYVPTRGESRVECINPNIITNPEQQGEFIEQLSQLNNMMNNNNVLEINKPETFKINKKDAIF